MQQNAETLNDYFVNVAGSKDSTSEEFGDHPSVHCIKIKNYNLAFKFHTDNLNPKKSVGIEKISSRATSLSAPVLSCEITRVINDFINTQSCLLVWKSSNVTPLHKKAHENEKSNHRPISILPVISKVYENVLFDQIYTAISPHFSSNLSGFLKGHSCCMALIKITEMTERVLLP